MRIAVTQRWKLAAAIDRECRSCGVVPGTAGYVEVPCNAAAGESDRTAKGGCRGVGRAGQGSRQFSAEPPMTAASPQFALREVCIELTEAPIARRRYQVEVGRTIGRRNLRHLAQHRFVLQRGAPPQALECEFGGG